MIELLLSTFLVLTPIPLVAPVFEEIRLTDNLVLKAEYVPINTYTSREGMLFTVEDFIVIQTEMQFCGKACDLRIEQLKQLHLDTLAEVQERCEDEYATLQSDLDNALEKNSQLHKSMEHERKWKSIFKWATFGVTAALVGTSSYILLNR